MTSGDEETPEAKAPAFAGAFCICVLAERTHRLFTSEMSDPSW
jgi:hypothetical protein